MDLRKIKFMHGFETKDNRWLIDFCAGMPLFKTNLRKPHQLTMVGGLLDWRVEGMAIS